MRESMAKAVEIANEFPYSSITSRDSCFFLKITASLQLTGEVRRIAEALSEKLLLQT